MIEDNRLRSQETLQAAILARLKKLYDEEQSTKIFNRLTELVSQFPMPSDFTQKLALSEKDAMLIAYGDHVQRPDEEPLITLNDVAQKLKLPISSLHILPFFPYSSDDGFSVIDYYAVDPDLGDWADIERLSHQFRLMFDAVFNHISAESDWFKGFLDGKQPYTDYFIVTDPQADLSLVTRPRTLPLLSPFETANGQVNVWTTFSSDQIDLNFANPDVLVEMMRILLFYVDKGTQFIRLDAIAYLWKQIGTTCIHLPETHLIIQLMRDVLDLVAPQTILLTETNVPHTENVSYFGDGDNEAQLVYQFPLPPLILHTLHKGNAVALTQWGQGIRRVSERTTFFNFTASHDGIGIRPVMGILDDTEIDALVQLTQAHGGYVSYKNNSDGSQSPYELNITYFDAITDPKVTTDQPETAISRFIVSQAIMLSFIGVPGIYFHSLFGSRNYEAGVTETGRYRTINREKLNADQLLVELENSNSIRSRIFSEYCKLLTTRSKEPAFHPLGDQVVLNLHPGVFSVDRISSDKTSRVLALHNISSQSVQLTIPTGDQTIWYNLLDNQLTYTSSESSLVLSLAPYQTVWLKAI